MKKMQQENQASSLLKIAGSSWYGSPAFPQVLFGIELMLMMLWWAEIAFPHLISNRKKKKEMKKKGEKNLGGKKTWGI